MALFLFLPALLHTYHRIVRERTSIPDVDNLKYNNMSLDKWEPSLAHATLRSLTLTFSIIQTVAHYPGQAVCRKTVCRIAVCKTIFI
jgi:hypothetical protein